MTIYGKGPFTYLVLTERLLSFSRSVFDSTNSNFNFDFGGCKVAKYESYTSFVRRYTYAKLRKFTDVCTWAGGKGEGNIVPGPHRQANAWKISRR